MIAYQGRMAELRVCHFPQIPCKPFQVAADSLREARKIMRVLAVYDQFLLDNRHRVDYCNAQTVQVFDADDYTDSLAGSWVDWESDDGESLDELSDERIDQLDSECV